MPFSISDIYPCKFSLSHALLRSLLSRIRLPLAGFAPSNWHASALGSVALHAGLTIGASLSRYWGFFHSPFVADFNAYRKVILIEQETATPLELSTPSAK